MSSLLHSLTGLMAAVVVPVVAIVGALSYVAYVMYLRVRTQREMLQMHHAERMAAIEKGIELPPLPPDLLRDQYRGDYDYGRRRYRGLITLLVGVAVALAMRHTPGTTTQWWWGLVIVAVGLGQVVIGYLERGAARSSSADPSSRAAEGIDPTRSGQG